MKYTKSALISAGFSIVPYVGVAWGYAALVDGDTGDFWLALGALFGARFFFFVIETIGGILSWRLYGRKAAVQQALVFLRENKFPLRENSEEDYLNYLYRIQNDSECPEPVRILAKESERELVRLEGMGILPGLRGMDAMERALALHTRKTT